MPTPRWKRTKTIYSSFFKNQTMQQIKTNIRSFFLISVLYLISCNEPATTSEKSDKDTAQVVATRDTPSMPAYDPALDPLTVAGANGKLLYDSLGIKIYETWAKPGEFTPLHSHPDHAIYVLEGGKAMFYSRDVPGAEKGIPIELKT